LVNWLRNCFLQGAADSLKRKNECQYRFKSLIVA